jgi:hypothetical protein
VFAAAAGCGASEDPFDRAGSLEYRYNDASVDPEFHRSYTLSLVGGGDAAPATGTFVVDAYGDVLHEADVTVEPDTWSAALDELASGDRDDVEVDGGCSGGTSRQLVIRSSGDDVALDRTVQVCGAEGGDAADELDAAIAPLLAELDLATLLG